MLFSTLLASGGDSGSGSSFISFLFLPLILVAAYFLMIRPMRRRQRDQNSLQRQIDVGDEVMTTAGIYGFITGIEGDVVWLEIDDDVQIRIARAGIQRRVTTDAPAEGRATDTTADLESADGE
jgi:preprotein translocase subunit YajC